MKIVVVGDAHFPYASKRALQLVYDTIKTEKPDAVVQIGDLLDQYTFSRYPRSQDFIGPEEEIRKGLKEATAFWNTVRKLAPKARYYQLIGNHDLRLVKRIQEKLPELSALYGLADLYQFRGVETMPDERTELHLGGTVFLHGHLSKLGDHTKKYLSNTVCGHSHQAGVFYQKVKGKVVWEMNVGFIGDESKLPLQYGQRKTTHWTAGVGVIDEHGPRFIPLKGKV